MCPSCVQLLQSSDLSDLIFVEPLMENMTNRLKDSSVTVRMLAVRGLGNIAGGYPEKVRTLQSGGRGSAGQYVYSACWLHYRSENMDPTC